MIVDLFVCWKSIQCQKPNMTQQNITLPQSHWWMNVDDLTNDGQAKSSLLDLLSSFRVETHKPFLIQNHHFHFHFHFHFISIVLLWRNKERKKVISSWTWTSWPVFILRSTSLLFNLLHFTLVSTILVFLLITITLSTLLF